MGGLCDRVTDELLWSLEPPVTHVCDRFRFADPGEHRGSIAARDRDRIVIDEFDEVTQEISNGIASFGRRRLKASKTSYQFTAFSVDIVRM